MQSKTRIILIVILLLIGLTFVRGENMTEVDCSTIGKKKDKINCLKNSILSLDTQKKLIYNKKGKFILGSIYRSSGADDKITYLEEIKSKLEANENCPYPDSDPGMKFKCDFKYRGCWADDTGDRAFDVKADNTTHDSVKNEVLDCAKKCMVKQTGKTTHVGLQWNGECFCGKKGTNFKKHNKKSGCTEIPIDTVRSSKDDTSWGGNRNHVYQIMKNKRKQLRRELRSEIRAQNEITEVNNAVANNKCYTLTELHPCYKHIEWAQANANNHPEWYNGGDGSYQLTNKSTTKDFQNDIFYRKGNGNYWTHPDRGTFPDRCPVIKPCYTSGETSQINGIATSNTSGASSNVANFTEAFDGTTITDDNIFTFPTGAQGWAGFANMNTALYPITIGNGKTLTFNASVPGGGSADVRFRFEKDPYPDVNPAYDTENVTVSGSDHTKYSLSLTGQGSNTFRSFILYIVTKDVGVKITDVKIE